MISVKIIILIRGVGTIYLFVFQKIAAAVLSAPKEAYQSIFSTAFHSMQTLMNV